MAKILSAVLRPRQPVIPAVLRLLHHGSDHTGRPSDLRYRAVGRDAQAAQRGGGADGDRHRGPSGPSAPIYDDLDGASNSADRVGVGAAGACARGAQNSSCRPPSRASRISTGILTRFTPGCASRIRTTIRWLISWINMTR